MLDGLTEGSFDTVVINSVVQYFPSGAYLETVLSNVLRLLAPGGSLFLGDLRNLLLSDCFQAGVQVTRWPGETDPDRLRAAVEQAVADDNELLVDPGFFTTLAERHPDVTGVDLRVRRGHGENELSRYRYDVVLTTAPAPAQSLAALPTLAWGTEVSDLAGLAEHLATTTTGLRLTALPNQRLLTDLVARHQAQLHQQDSPRTELSARENVPALEELVTFGAAAGFEVIATWSPTDPAALDVLFVDHHEPGTARTDVYLAPAVLPATLTSTPRH